LGFNETGEISGVRAKLKIKKPNSTLNETIKQIHLRTENNVNFKPHIDHSIPRKIIEY